MNSENFAYWLQGYFELLGKDEPLTKEQTQIIKDHLALVFDKVTPDRKVEPVKNKEPDKWPSIDYNPFDRPDVFCAPTTVEAPAQPTVVPGKLDVNEIVKKIEERQRVGNPDTRTYCASKTGVEYWAGRHEISGGLGGRVC
jgi:hypothetical protein